MKQNSNILHCIAYRELSPADKATLHSTLAAGNLAVEALAKSPGMAWGKRDAYRNVILGRLTHHPECTPDEVAACHALVPAGKRAIGEIEAAKYRLLEGVVKLLVKEVKKKLKFAQFFVKGSKSKHCHDLSEEALIAFLHATYRFNRHDIQFSTFLTTVVSNHLLECCERLPIIKLSEDLKTLIPLYRSIEGENAKAGRPYDFDSVVRVIVGKELRDRGVAETEHNLAAATEDQRVRFVELHQALGQHRSLREECSPRSRRQLMKPDTKRMFTDLKIDLTPLQHKTVIAKMRGQSLQDVAAAAGVPIQDVKEAFRRAKEWASQTVV